MRVGIPKEPDPAERRVAVTPTIAKSMAGLATVTVEPDAGRAAGFPDEAFRANGAEIGDPWSAEVIAIVGPPPGDHLARAGEGATVIGFLAPFTDGAVVRTLAERKLTAFAFEAMPRTTLAQSMDALSSQATAAGYAAVLAAAAASPRFFPMLTTAAGTIRPSRVLVLGTGVAGLQAVATARRLGAIVSAYDIRPEAREQVESLGASFVEAPVDAEAATAAGYAREVAEDAQRRQLEALTPEVARSDVVITTALIPGRPAPLLIDAGMVERMRPGTVIVDVAAPAGGNCALTRPGAEVVHAGVSILGPEDLPSRVASDASDMYGRNVLELLRHLTAEGEIELDFDDEIVDGACVAHAGEIRHPEARRAAGSEEAG